MFYKFLEAWTINLGGAPLAKSEREEPELPGCNANYSMKPYNIKVPKCALISLMNFNFPGRGSHVLTGTAMASCGRCR